MERRDFVIASGSTILSGLITSHLSRSAVGLNFEVSAPNKDPSEVDSLLVGFETLEVTPRYLDESDPISVQAKLEVAGRTDKTSEFQASVENGKTVELKNRIDTMVVEGIDKSTFIRGDVTVMIDHPNVQDSYSQSFKVAKDAEPIPQPSSGLARWKFEQDVKDDWGSYDGTNITSVGYTNGIIGNYSKDFDSTNDDYVSTGWYGPTGEFSVSAWVYPRKYHDGKFVNNHNSPSGEHFIMGFNDGDKFYFFVDDGSVGISFKEPDSMSLNEWQHFVGTFDGIDTINGYKNGTNLFTKQNTSFGSYDNPDLEITMGVESHDKTTRPFDGRLDDVRIYDRELTSKEVSNLYDTNSING